eukprot:gnl/TRDRNA2_/TRDRNA2_182775_c0_seq1.p2 gnl/TRDRNA2_/TRDRNA2_182775_c0~~gnl/TRDRNA2_/TRDRNA2_182775_c0_seq1.p2  ORF type:complete len:221 (-),score=74.75 gnl/TRDRNA2_/TRDRNA2_182775_c0_seq1:116-778(-)
MRYTSMLAIATLLATLSPGEASRFRKHFQATEHVTEAPATTDPGTTEVPELTTAKPALISVDKAEDVAPFVAAELSPEAAAGVAKAEAELGMNAEQAPQDAKPALGFVDASGQADDAASEDDGAPFATAELSPLAAGGVAKAEAEIEQEYAQAEKEAEAAPSFIQVTTKVGSAAVTTAKPAGDAAKEQLRIQPPSLPVKLELVNPLQSAQQPLQLRNPLL